MINRKKKTLYWFVCGEPEDACPRYRAYIYRSWFEANGCRVRYYYLLHYTYKRIRAWFAGQLERVLPFKPLVRAFSALFTELTRAPANFLADTRHQIAALAYGKVVFQRRTPGRPLQLLLKALGRDLYFDLDDALYLNPPPQNQQGDSAVITENVRQARDFRDFMGRCKGVIVSNNHLRDWVLTSNPRVAVIPTSYPASPGALSRRAANRPGHPILCWMGAIENQRYLAGILPALREVHREFPSLELRVITRKHWRYDAPFVTPVEWNAEGFAGFLESCTVGLAPLVDDEWCRGKMQFKAVQYMAHGLPTVASPVGLAPETWTDGDNILMAGSLEEWYRQILLLLRNPILCEELSQKGYRTVERIYAPDRNSSLLYDFLFSA